MIREIGQSADSWISEWPAKRCDYNYEDHYDYDDYYVDYNHYDYDYYYVDHYDYNNHCDVCWISEWSVVSEEM